VVLALHLRRDYWDSILSQVDSSAGGDGQYSSSGTNRWRSSLRASNVVVQWDPDHKPFTGHKSDYR
ncbi:unnamed protein product, partial [Laminaria digitata]